MTDAPGWQERVVGRSLRTAAERSVDRGRALIDAAVAVLERADGADITVQEIADEAGQSLRTLYQYFESKDDLLLALFEESMRTYASLIETAIATLDDPVDRLAGAMVAAARMPEVVSTGVDRGLARLRLELAESRPDLVGEAQGALVALVRDLVDAVGVDDPEAATFMLLALNAAFVTSGTLGNDTGVHRPDVATTVAFCLRGLGADLDDGWYERVSAAVSLRPARARSRRRSTS